MSTDLTEQTETETETEAQLHEIAAYFPYSWENQVVEDIPLREILIEGLEQMHEDGLLTEDDMLLGVGEALMIDLEQGGEVNIRLDDDVSIKFKSTPQQPDTIQIRGTDNSTETATQLTISERQLSLTFTPGPGESHEDYVERMRELKADHFNETPETDASHQPATERNLDQINSFQKLKALAGSKLGKSDDYWLEQEQEKLLSLPPLTKIAQDIADIELPAHVTVQVFQDLRAGGHVMAGIYDTIAHHKEKFGDDHAIGRDEFARMIEDAFFPPEAPVLSSTTNEPTSVDHDSKNFDTGLINKPNMP